jgi:hypothetical protein
MEENVKENYKPIAPKEQHGIEDRDFIWERKKMFIGELKKIY